MKLSIIIVSYNTSTLLQNCLSSVYKALSFGNLDKTSEVIVVDNASADESVRMVAENFPKVHLICNKKNVGFAKANNQGIRKAKGKYILLLNSDTVVPPDALTNLLIAAKKEKDVAVVGGRLLNTDGSIQASAGFSPNLFRVFCWMTFLDDLPYLSLFLQPYHIEERKFYEKPQQIDWVSGACLLLKREVLAKVGSLDEKIFMYGEEVEWCYRVAKAGYKILYTPEANIYHSKGASGEGKEAGIIEEYSYLRYFYLKHKPYWQYLILSALLAYGALLRFVVFGIIGRYRERRDLYAKLLKKA